MTSGPFSGFELWLVDAREREDNDQVVFWARKIREARAILQYILSTNDKAYFGHGDFPGGDRFDYTLEDNDPLTSPFYDPERHFRPLWMSIRDARSAVTRCDKEAFSRAMHRGQDYFSHYRPGFRWDPPGKLGHIFDGNADNPSVHWGAYMDAWKWSQAWVDEWDRHCSCEGKP